MNEKSETKRTCEPTKKFFLNFLWLLIIPITYFLVMLANANPVFVENVYSGAIYNVVSKIIPFQYFPQISFFEIVLIGGPIAIIVCLIVFIVRLVRNRERRVMRILNVIRNALIVCAVAYFLFYLLWGFNYSRLPYSEIANLSIEKSSKSELEELCVSLIERTNDARTRLPSASNGTLNMSLSSAELRSITKKAYIKAA